jgi:hypothetical protein
VLAHDSELVERHRLGKFVGGVAAVLSIQAAGKGSQGRPRITA